MRFSATVYGRRSQKSNIGWLVGWLVSWPVSLDARFLRAWVDKANCCDGDSFRASSIPSYCISCFNVIIFSSPSPRLQSPFARRIRGVDAFRCGDLT